MVGGLPNRSTPLTTRPAPKIWWRLHQPARSARKPRRRVNLLSAAGVCSRLLGRAIGIRHHVLVLRGLCGTAPHAIDLRLGALGELLRKQEKLVAPAAASPPRQADLSRRTIRLQRSGNERGSHQHAGIDREFIRRRVRGDQSADAGTNGSADAGTNGRQRRFSWSLSSCLIASSINFASSR